MDYSKPLPPSAFNETKFLSMKEDILSETPKPLPVDTYNQIQQNAMRNYLLEDDSLLNIIQDLSNDISKAAIPIPLKINDMGSTDYLSPAISPSTYFMQDVYQSSVLDNSQTLSQDQLLKVRERPNQDVSQTLLQAAPLQNISYTIVKNPLQNKSQSILQSTTYSPAPSGSQSLYTPDKYQTYSVGTNPLPASASQPDSSSQQSPPPSQPDSSSQQSPPPSQPINSYVAPSPPPSQPINSYVAPSPPPFSLS
jgi:hypothetical protein